MSKWFLNVWSYPFVFFDDDQTLLIIKINKFLELEDLTTLFRMSYPIFDRLSIIEEWEKQLRPTENEALENLFYLSLKAESYRLSHDTSKRP